MPSALVGDASRPHSGGGRLPERFDLANPHNQKELDAVEDLAQLADEAGITLIQLAIAFVLNHPAITSPLIGPRTMEQLESRLAAADVVLSTELLDRIHQINPPGITINPADNSWLNPALEPTALRRWLRTSDGVKKTASQLAALGPDGLPLASPGVGRIPPPTRHGHTRSNPERSRRRRSGHAARTSDATSHGGRR